MSKDEAVLQVFELMMQHGLQMSDLSGKWQAFLLSKYAKRREAKAAFMAQVGERLAQTGWKQCRLAYKIHVSPPCVSAWLSGKKFPSREFGERICRVLDFEWDLGCLEEGVDA